MRVLGVNAAAARAYLACADNGELVEVDPHVIEFPAGLEAGKRLPATKDDLSRLFERLRVARVRVLTPEATYTSTYKSLIPRLTMETLVALAAAERDIDCARLSRRRVRSLLGLPVAGSLQ
jgi:hypothetical protein